MLLRWVLVFLGTTSCISAANLTDVVTPNPTDNVTSLMTTNVTQTSSSGKADTMTSLNVNGMLTSSITDVSIPAMTASLPSELNGNLSASEIVTPNTIGISASSAGDQRATEVNGSDAVAGDNDSSADIPRYQLPSDWSTFCYLTSEIYQTTAFTPSTNLTVIKCHVTENMSGVWKMEDLRESMRLFSTSGNINNTRLTTSSANGIRVSNSSHMIGLDITCTQNSNISVPWPMKVHNLMKVKISNCIITDYLKDSEEAYVEEMPDTIRVIEIVDNVMMISIEHFIALMENVKSVGKEFDCGHDTSLEKLVSRNVTYDFTDSIEVIIENLSRLGNKYMQDVKRIKHTCEFTHLLYLEEGNSSSTSKFHVQLQTAHSFFDVLKTYNISNNGMSELGETELFWFLNFPTLQTLDLSHNQISEIGQFEEPLDSDPSLRTTINLQYNNISTITMKNIRMFQDLSERVLIDIRNNPIGCECSQPFKDVLDFIQDSQNNDLLTNGSFYSYLKELTCASPASLKGVMLGAQSSASACPEVKSYLIGPIVGVSVTCVLLIVCLILVLRYRKELTIFLFVRLNIVVPWQRRTRMDQNKLYDAFVSYSSKEEDWVEDFFENLEHSADDSALGAQNRTFKLCLHHRDFTAGKTIFENVVKSVESSRHTIIILSKHYLNSEFCLYEFQQAFQQSIMEQKRHLVIVMCGDIPHEELPRDLKRCIKTFTYIRKDDFMFKSRLVYALSVNQETRTVKKEKPDHANTAVKLEMSASKSKQSSEKNEHSVQKMAGTISTPSVRASNMITDKPVITIPLHEIIPCEDMQNFVENEKSFVDENTCAVSLPNADTNSVDIDQCVCSETETLYTMDGVTTDSADPMRKEYEIRDTNETDEVVDSKKYNIEYANETCKYHSQPHLNTSDSHAVIELHKHVAKDANETYKDHELEELDTTVDRDEVLEIHEHNTNETQNAQAIQPHDATKIGNNSGVSRDVKIKISPPDTRNSDYERLENVKGLNHVDYDRSMSEISYDTGYGSDRGSSIDHQLSLESCQSPCIDGVNMLASRLNDLGTM